jgi:hypothetical protein
MDEKKEKKKEEARNQGTHIPGLQIPSPQPFVCRNPHYT